MASRPRNKAPAAERPQAGTAGPLSAAPQSSGADAALPPAAPPGSVAVEMLQVTGPRRPYRRAGHAFGPEPVLIDPRDLTDDQMAALTSDPNLIVRGAGRLKG